MREGRDEEEEEEQRDGGRRGWHGVDQGYCFGVLAQATSMPCWLVPLRQFQNPETERRCVSKAGFGAFGAVFTECFEQSARTVGEH